MFFLVHMEHDHGHFIGRMVVKNGKYIRQRMSITNQITENNYGFLYGHDEPFKPNNLKQRKYLRFL